MGYFKRNFVGAGFDSLEIQPEFYRKVRYNRLALFGILPPDYQDEGDSILATYRTRQDMIDHVEEVRKMKELLRFAESLGGQVAGVVDYA